MISYLNYNVINLLVDKNYSSPETYLNLRLLCKDSLNLCNTIKTRYNCNLLNYLIIKKLGFEKEDVCDFDKNLYTEIIYWFSNNLLEYNFKNELTIFDKFKLLNSDNLNPLKNYKPIKRIRILKDCKNSNNNYLYELLYEPRLTKFIKSRDYYDL